MDREYPSSRAELEDKERWPYNDVQSLAAELDYGPIVGEDRADLIDHSVEALDLPPTEADSQVDRETDRQGSTVATQGDNTSSQEDVEEDSDRSTATYEPAGDGDRAPDRGKTDGGTQTAPSTESIEVGHEGSEKLQPEGAPESDGTAVAPPEGLESEDIDPDLLEPGATESATESSAGATEVEQTGADHGEEVQEPDDSEDQSDGGLRERLGLGGDESSEDVVEEADDPEERERREQFKKKLEGAMGGADQEDVEDAVDDAGGSQAPSTSPGTTTAQGMVVDEEIVENLIAMPFNFAAGATDWDGWELSKQERQANARLFVAMCDEHDVDVGPTVMFALSMGGTAMGKTMRYRRYKASQEPDEPELEDGADSETFDDDVQDVAGRDGRRGRGDQGGGPTPSSTAQQTQTTADEDFGF